MGFTVLPVKLALYTVCKKCTNKKSVFYSFAVHCIYRMTNNKIDHLKI